MVKPGQNILFLVPSIALLSQTLRAWTADASCAAALLCCVLGQQGQPQ
jgi:predicted helicase